MPINLEPGIDFEPDPEAISKFADMIVGYLGGGPVQTAALETIEVTVNGEGLSILLDTLKNLVPSL